MGIKENVIKILGGFTSEEYTKKDTEAKDLDKRNTDLLVSKKKLEQDNVTLFNTGAKLNDELLTLKAIQSREDDLQHYGEIGLKLKNMGLKMIKNKAYENKDKIKIEIDDNGSVAVTKPTEKTRSEPTSMDFAKALENVDADKQFIDCKELFKPNDPERQPAFATSTRSTRC